MEDPYLLFMLENFGYLDVRIHHFFAHCVNECHTTYDHVQHKVSHTKTLAKKKRKFYWYLVKIVEHWKPSELPLQMHNTRCILHTYSSTVEILKNWIWNCRTLFSKINKYSAKKFQTSVVGIVLKVSRSVG